MVKVAPEGLGIWIAFGGMIGSPKEVVRRCKELGASWIAPRLGEGANRDGWYKPNVAKELCDLAHKEGMKVAPWIFNRPTAMSGELNLYKAALDEGADFLLLDAEVPYNGKKAEAKVFVSLLKKQFPDVWIGNAPFSYVGWHTDYPYVEFGELDGAMDQLYWTEFTSKGAKTHCLETDKHWDAFIKAHPTTATRMPIGVTYGSELGKKWGMKTAPPGPITVDDVKFFLDHYENYGCYSLYSLEATDEKVYAYLKQRNLDKIAANATIEHGPVPPIVEPLPQPEPTPEPLPEPQPEPIPQPEPEPTPIVVVDNKTNIFDMILAFIQMILSMFTPKK